MRAFERDVHRQVPPTAAGPGRAMAYWRKNDGPSRFLLPISETQGVYGRF
jgi:hypothetical protein